MSKKPQSKNVGPFLAFTKDWFKERQNILLWLLNTPVIRIWARWILRIHKVIPIKEKILELGQNFFTYNGHWEYHRYLERNGSPALVFVGRYKDWKLNRHSRRALKSLGYGEEKSGNLWFQTTDFRCHPKFAKRVYFAFKPIWWAAHYWDEFFADQLVPQLSFGFSTLTAFPDPNPETSTVDGLAARVTAAETWATKIAGAGIQANDTSTQEWMFEITAGAASNWVGLNRFIFLFDTSVITAGGTISATVMSILGFSKQDGLAVTPNIDVYTSTPASNTAVVAADYTQLGSTSQTGSPITYAGWNAAAYNDFTFNATGLGNVSKTSISKFGVRNANYDVAAVAPTFSSNGDSRLGGNTADFAGTGSDPKLVVTYSTTSVKTVDGLAIGSVKTGLGLAVASVKTWMGLA